MAAVICRYVDILHWIMACTQNSPASEAGDTHTTHSICNMQRILHIHVLCCQLVLTLLLHAVFAGCLLQVRSHFSAALRDGKRTTARPNLTGFRCCAQAHKQSLCLQGAVQLAAGSALVRGVAGSSVSGKSSTTEHIPQLCCSSLSVTSKHASALTLSNLVPLKKLQP